MAYVTLILLASDLVTWHHQLCWHCLPLCAGIMALIVLALLPLSCWHC